MENIDEIKNENLLLKNRITELEERLKKYTSGNNHKKYYEKNKEKIMESSAQYLSKLKEENPEKIKEYRRRAYLKMKEKAEQKKIESI